MTILATIETDDSVGCVDFDAEPWFEQASDSDIQDVAIEGYGNGYASDNIAEFVANHDQSVKDVFEYLDQANAMHRMRRSPLTGYSVIINEFDVEAWLKEHRPHLIIEKE